MKKLFFSFVMLVTLVIVAGSANAQTKTTPYPGGTYSYKLTGIKTNSAGTATISYSGTNVTIQNVNGAGLLVPYTAPVNTPAGTSTDLTFDIKFGENATDGKITVTVTDGVASGGCSNFIEYAIDVQPLPTLALSIDATAGAFCQKKNSSPLTDNTAASVSAPLNSFDFTVTPVITNDPDAYTYTYAISLPNASGLANYKIEYAGPGSYNAGVVSNANSETPGVFTITFDTTTGLAPVNLTATITGTPTLTATKGNAVYNGTITTASDVVTVNTMPSIGNFE
jgi:hypothetical protein